MNREYRPFRRRTLLVSETAWQSQLLFHCYGTQPTGQIADPSGTVHSLRVAAHTAERATPRRERRSRKECRGEVIETKTGGKGAKRAKGAAPISAGRRQ
jgi:hypothetical protein